MPRSQAVVARRTERSSPMPRRIAMIGAPAKASSNMLSLARDAVALQGAVGVLLMPEAPMDWEAVREATGDARVLVAVTSPRARQGVEAAGLAPVEPVDPLHVAGL